MVGTTVQNLEIESFSKCARPAQPHSPTVFVGDIEGLDMGIRYSGLASAIANGQRVTFDLAIPASWGDVEGLSIQVGYGAPIWFPKHGLDGDRLVSVRKGERIVFVRENDQTARIEMER
jgi:hypothetical protein